MLCINILLALTLVITVGNCLVCPLRQTASDTEDQRQSIQFGFEQVHPLGETVFLINNQQTIRVTGRGSKFCAIPVHQTLMYQNGSVVFIDENIESPTTQQFPVNKLTIFNNVNGLFELQTFSGDVALRDLSLTNLPDGYFYYDRDRRALFTNTLIVESQRPFPPLFDPQLEILFPIRGAPPNDRLILNIDDTGTRPDGVVDFRDDLITLTGSSCIALSERESLEYIANSSLILVRSGSQISSVFPGIVNLNVLTLIQSLTGATECLIQRLETVDGPAVIFSGPGTLFTNGGDAFYTTIPYILRDIGEQILNSQFKFRTSTSPPSAILQSTLGQSGGNDLIELVGTTTTTYPTASTISYNGGVISVNDGGGNLLKQIGTAINSVDLSTFFSNEVQQFSGGVTGSFDVPPGGLALIFNSETGSVFAYARRNTCTALTVVIPKVTPPLIRFNFSFDGLGGAILTGQRGGEDEIELVTISISQQYDVGVGDIIRYSGNTLTVQDRGGETATFPNIDLFSANSPPNTLQSCTGEAIQTYSGRGRLYFDSQDRAFFTSNLNLINRVEDYLSNLPGVDPLLKTRTLNGSTVVNIETPGGRRLVELSSSTILTMPGDFSLVFFNEEVSIAITLDIPQNSQAFYNAFNNRVNISDTLFSARVQDFYAYLTIGGPVEAITEDTIFPSNGILYTGVDGALYSINDNINGPIVNTLNDIGAIAETITQSYELSFYDGHSIRIFTGNSPTLLPGGGTIFSSKGQSYYTL